jgi:ribosomal-protein-alanine N-acetyltransferase
MHADITVRLATAADAREIATISRDDIEYGLPWNWVPARVLHSIENPDTNVAVVGATGGLTAFGIMSHAEDDAHLLLFAVRRSSRGRGVGSALLLWLEEVARTAGAMRIRVEARRGNAAARSFYNAHGYHEREIARAMYSGRVDGVRLEKWLRPRPRIGSRAGPVG